MWVKILAGSTVGVGAVAAAPFTGGGSLLGGASLIASLSGAGTIAAAIGAGTVGGLVGAAVAEDDENKMEQAKEQARAEEKAENALQIKILETDNARLNFTLTYERITRDLDSIIKKCEDICETLEEIKGDIDDIVAVMAQNLESN